MGDVEQEAIGIMEQEAMAVMEQADPHGQCGARGNRGHGAGHNWSMWSKRLLV